MGNPESLPDWFPRRSQSQYRGKDAKSLASDILQRIFDADTERIGTLTEEVKSLVKTNDVLVGNFQDRLENIEDKEIQRERLERFPDFIHSLVLSGAIKGAIKNGFLHHHTTEQIIRAIRKVARDYENFTMERR